MVFLGGGVGDTARYFRGQTERDRKREENALISVSIWSLLSGNLNMRNCPLATKMHGLLN